MRHIIRTSVLLATITLLGVAHAAERKAAVPQKRALESAVKAPPETLKTSNMPVQWQLDRLRESLQRLQNEVGAMRAQANPDTSQVEQLSQRLASIESVLLISPGNVTLRSTGNLTIDAGGKTTVEGAVVDMNTATANVNGVMKAKTVVTDQVVSKSYTPGAGNVW